MKGRKVCVWLTGLILGLGFASGAVVQTKKKNLKYFVPKPNEIYVDGDVPSALSREAIPSLATPYFNIKQLSGILQSK